MTPTRVYLTLACLALAGCQVDLSLANSPEGFSCLTDDDCVDGFFCDNIGEPDGALGRCVSEGVVGPDECVDRDGDGASVGAGCTSGVPIDCDDDNNAIGPSAPEICDGIDNNCNCDRQSGDTNGDGTICGIGDDFVDEDLPMRPCPLQVGLCAGAQRGCVDGAYADCASAGLYGEGFEPNEVSCDGINNDCDNETDESCECVPGEDFAFECGTEIGSCERGVQLCLDSGRLSDCIDSDVGSVCMNGDPCSVDADCVDGMGCGIELCETNEDCGEGGICVEEWLDDREDFFDDCVDDGDPECRRSVCHYLDAEAPACLTDDDCSGGELCIADACRPTAASRIDELCNGIDDDCDGSIDNDFSRTEICGPCPFNMQFTNIVTPANNPDFVCIDWYEASRPDATDTDPGSIELYTLPRPGVIPWTGMTPEIAETVCRGEPLREVATGTNTPIPTKRLCKTYEWRQGCGGTTGTVEEASYPYSTQSEDDYVAGACNDGSLGLTAPGLTGSSADCCRGEVCDMSGNVAEYVRDASSTAQLAGGGYNDTDEDVLSCGDGLAYEPIPADIEDRDDIGFRCCTLRQR